MHAYSLLLFGLLFFVLSLSIEPSEASMLVEWDTEFKQSVANGNGEAHSVFWKRYSASKRYTRIEDEKGHIILIDYALPTLYRFTKQSTACEKYALEDPGSEYPAAGDSPVSQQDHLCRLLGSIRVSPSSETGEVAGFKAKKTQVYFGADIRMFQMLAPPVLTVLGQNFTERQVNYMIRQDVPHFAILKDLAGHHEPVFQANPLLRQIDPVGLINVLNGFYVQAGERGKTATTEIMNQIHLKVYDKTFFIVPASCIKNP